MEPKRHIRGPAPRHPRRTPRVDELGPPHPTPPPVCVVVTPPQTFITIDDTVRQRIVNIAKGARFDGEDRTFTAYAAMTPTEQGRQYADVVKRSQAWINAVFLATDALWFTVVDGEIAAASHDLNSMPTHSDRWKEGERTGKVPYLFIHPSATQI